jgi:hypothetical protein
MSFALRSDSIPLTPTAAIAETLVIAWHDWMISQGVFCNAAVAAVGEAALLAPRARAGVFV